MPDTEPAHTTGWPHRAAPARRPRLPRMLAGTHQGVLLFSVTPPRRSETEERIAQIAAVTLDRLAGLDLDGLILYDIDDEAARNPESTFPNLWISAGVL